MRDEPHVGLVDSHPEGDRGADHHVLARDERRLVRRAYLSRQARMVAAHFAFSVG